MPDKYYLRIAFASDLEKTSERIFYRFLEMLPGLMTWLSFFGVILLSYFRPIWVSVFIIVFVIYWLSKTMYFSFHLKASYRQMKQHREIDWLGKLNKLGAASNGLPVRHWQEIYHLVVLPMYKEPDEVVRDSLKSLLETDYPKDRMIVILAQEERAGDDFNNNLTQKISREFQNSFFRFFITVHPKDRSGEIAAKSSNETWAARTGEELISGLNIPFEKVIFSSFDIDTVVSPNYFSCLTYHYLTTPKPLRTSFQPIPLFLNNVWQAPGISRIFSFSSSFWHLTNQERPEKLITFSSHSMPFKALVDVGFKQTDVVSDDSRIFWQCLFYYDGDYRVEPLHCPISMDANAAETLRRTLIHMYKQQRRWAYGAAEIAYFTFGFLKNKKISFKRKIALAFEIIEGQWNWACAPILIFVLGWLPVYLGGAEFTQTIFSYNLPKILGRILAVSMLGLVMSMYYTFYLLPPKPDTKRQKLNLLWACSQWILLPFTMIFFVALPAIDAQTRLLLGKYMGFWPTPKHRKAIKQPSN
ncbi:glycosyltransferase family 2 protein [Patescibacteria group bacterium]|nr:glycosyltransferase family 2 protein [Patescibacteria group bacterium]